ncbi:MAG: efflux RND transporter periplasmic adaptor subunit [Deltaproteobacteria bacterium]|nr:efflux RND transporter periplasmic adaptor subunit [Deltaproteobacteria bacterium]
MGKNKAIIAAAIAGLAIGGILAFYGSRYFSDSGIGADEKAVSKRKILYWHDPMDPSFKSDKPGKSPMGMDLTPVYEDEAGGAVGAGGAISIGALATQTIGVRTEKAGHAEVTRHIKTVGRVEFDEKRVYQVHAKVDGWIEKLYVSSTGADVKKDDMLLSIYSPALVSAEEEYLLALKNRKKMEKAGRESFVALSRKRLELYDVPAHQIKELEKTGEIIKSLHIHSPVSGIVVDKPVTEGMYVEPGTKLYTLADLSVVWVIADVYEKDIAWIKAGQKADITVASYPGKTFDGTVSFVYPFVEDQTRTNKVRLVLDNKDGLLKPDMYATVSFKSTVKHAAVAVPSEAVIRSGERSVVIVSLGGGKFEPRNVTLGVEGEGIYEITDGVKEGEDVVTSAQFLIDSESSMREAIKNLGNAKESKAGAGGGDAAREDKKGKAATGHEHHH